MGSTAQRDDTLLHRCLKSNSIPKESKGCFVIDEPINPRILCLELSARLGVVKGIAEDMVEGTDGRGLGCHSVRLSILVAMASTE